MSTGNKTHRIFDNSINKMYAIYADGIANTQRDPASCGVGHQITFLERLKKSIYCKKIWL